MAKSDLLASYSPGPGIGALSVATIKLSLYSKYRDFLDFILSEKYKFLNKYELFTSFNIVFLLSS